MPGNSSVHVEGTNLEALKRTLLPNSSKRVRHIARPQFFYLGPFNSILKPGLLNMCGPPSSHILHNLITIPCLDVMQLTKVSLQNLLFDWNLNLIGLLEQNFIFDANFEGHVN